MDEDDKETCIKATAKAEFIFQSTFELDISTATAMALARISALVSLVVAASQVANAGLIKRVTCPTGQVTSNAACCSQSHQFSFLRMPSDFYSFATCQTSSPLSTRSNVIFLTVVNVVKKSVLPCLDRNYETRLNVM